MNEMCPSALRSCNRRMSQAGDWSAGGVMRTAQPGSSLGRGLQSSVGVWDFLWFSEKPAPLFVGLYA